MNRFRRSTRILGIVALAGGFSLEGYSAPRWPIQVDDKPGILSSNRVGQNATSSDSFPCNINNSKTQTPDDPRSKHTVALSWNASTSLLPSPAPGEGYNVYRLNSDNSCTKINGSVPIVSTTAVDPAVELGKTYYYAVRAFKQNTESRDASNVAVVTISLI